MTLHDGPTRKPRTVVNIEKAAPWCVGSNLERYKWKAPEVSDSSPHTGEDGYLVRGVKIAPAFVRTAGVVCFP